VVNFNKKDNKNNDIKGKKLELKDVRFSYEKTLKNIDWGESVHVRRGNTMVLNWKARGHRYELKKSINLAL
jgi:hypothetical protein